MSTFVTNRNYVRAIGIHNLSLVTRNKGMADSDVLISSVYHILFLNYYADTYTYEAMSAIKSDKSLYRFRIKKHVDAALAFLDKYEKDINSIMGIKYGDNFFEMNNGITDRFQKVFDKLKAEIYRTFEEKHVQNIEIASRVMMAYMFNAFASENLARLVEYNYGKNPIISRVEWASHKPLHRYLKDICQFLNLPDISKDIKVYSHFKKFQSMWHDFEFIADAICNAKYDETDEADELREVMKRV